MPIQVLKPLVTCNLPKHPSTIASVDSNDSNDSTSSSESNTTTTSPPSPSSQTDSPHIVIQGSEDEPQHPEEEMGDWDMHPVLPTLVACIDAIKQSPVLENLSEPPLQDRCHQIAQLLVSPTHPRVHIRNVSPGEYTTVLSLGAEHKAYRPSARFFYSAQNENLTIMPAYDIHEGINKYFHSIVIANLSRMGIVEDHLCSVEVDMGGRLESGGVCHVPDLMLTVNNVSGVQSDQRIFPIWLLETAFSQDAAQAIEKAIVMTDANPSVNLFILVDIEERTPSCNNSSPSHDAIAAEPQLSEPEFRSHCSDPTSFGPIVVKGVEWMNVIKIAFKTFLRNEQGVFDFESHDSTYTASGTLLPPPDICMKEVERHIAVGIQEVIEAVIRVKLDAGVPSNDPDIKELRALDPQSSLKCDWEGFLRKLNVRIFSSAHQRYVDWYRKRKCSDGIDGGRGVIKRHKTNGVSSVDIIGTPSTRSGRPRVLHKGGRHKQKKRETR